MAELDFDPFEGGADGARPVPLGAVMNFAGAACSVALLLGLAVWGYQLAVRDVQGVPVMRALADPMRIAPEVPGGEVALHQGLSVNAVAAVGTAVALPDQILLAPAPVDLTLEDAPGLLDGAVADTAAAQGLAQGLAQAVLPDAPAPVQVEVPSAAAFAEPATTDATAVALALADALAEGVAPFDAALDAPNSDVPTPDPVTSDLLTPDLLTPDLLTLAATDAAPRLSPRPQPRPASRAPQPAGADGGPQSAPIATPEIDPGTLAAGTRLVQLGAFDSDADARTEWSRLFARFGDLMAGKSMVVQAAQSGGRTFYRLRAHGFDGEDDSRRFCAALVAENTPCIPALHR